MRTSNLIPALLLLAGTLARPLDYHEGLKYPHLLRDPSKPDLLQRILAPRTPTVAR